MSLQENCEQNKMLLKPLVRLIHLLLHPGQTPQMCHAPPLLPAAVFRPWPGALLLHRRLCLQAIPVLVCHALWAFLSHPPHSDPCSPRYQPKEIADSLDQLFSLSACMPRLHGMFWESFFSHFWNQWHGINKTSLPAWALTDCSH